MSNTSYFKTPVHPNAAASKSSASPSVTLLGPSAVQGSETMRIAKVFRVVVIL